MEWTIYHRDEAGAPELHGDPGDGKPWFFEPRDWAAGEVYSEGYATREEACKACEEWIEAFGGWADFLLGEDSGG